MKYSQFDPYQMKNHRIIWSCNFEPTNAKEAAKYSCTPVNCPSPKGNGLQRV